MMETIAVLFIFFIMVFIGIIFYSRIMRSSLQEEVDRIQSLEIIAIDQLASSLPELQCSQNSIMRGNCIDLYKLSAAEDVILPEDYFDIFGYANITVYEVYPGAEEYPLYSFRSNRTRSKLTTFLPISLYQPKEENYRFGVMKIEVFR